MRGDGDGIWGRVRLSRGGEGWIKNRRAFWWDVIWFLIDTRPSLIGPRRESDGSQAQLSLDQIYADVSPASSMTFLKMKAHTRERCHVEQSERRQQGYRNQVSNLNPLVTIYFPLQIDSLSKKEKPKEKQRSQLFRIKQSFAVDFVAFTSNPLRR